MATGPYWRLPTGRSLRSAIVPFERGISPAVARRKSFRHPGLAEGTLSSRGAAGSWRSHAAWVSGGCGPARLAQNAREVGEVRCVLPDPLGQVARVGRIRVPLVRRGDPELLHAQDPARRDQASAGLNQRIPDRFLGQSGPAFVRLSIVFLAGPVAFPFGRLGRALAYLLGLFRGQSRDGRRSSRDPPPRSTRTSPWTCGSA